MQRIILVAPTLGAIALGTNRINWLFRDVEVVGVQNSGQREPFPDILLMFRALHILGKNLLESDSGANAAIILANEAVSFLEPIPEWARATRVIPKRVTLTIGTVLICYRGGGIRLTTTSYWIPDVYRKEIVHLIDKFGGEVADESISPPEKTIMHSTSVIETALHTTIDLPVTELHDTVH